MRKRKVKAVVWSMYLRVEGVRNDDSRVVEVERFERFARFERVALVERKRRRMDDNEE